MFEIKRNIFKSSAKMPGHYQPIASPMTRTDTNSAYQTIEQNPPLDYNVRHAPCPRIGEKV